MREYDSAPPVSMLEQLGYAVLKPHEVRTALGGALKLGLGIIQHTCAQTHTSVVALEYIVIDTALAACPELLVIGQLGERHGAITHLRVEFHHRQ